MFSLAQILEDYPWRGQNLPILNDSLSLINKLFQQFFLPIRIFSGLRSLYKILCECRYSIARTNSAK